MLLCKKNFYWTVIYILKTCNLKRRNFKKYYLSIINSWRSGHLIGDSRIRYISKDLVEIRFYAWLCGLRPRNCERLKLWKVSSLSCPPFQGHWIWIIEYPAQAFFDRKGQLRLQGLRNIGRENMNKLSIQNQSSWTPRYFTQKRSQGTSKWATAFTVLYFRQFFIYGPDTKKWD